MAILIYRIRNDSFSFPYPRELVAVFDDNKFNKVSAFVDKANHTRRSDWVTILTCARNNDYNWENTPEGVLVNPRLTVSKFRLPGETDEFIY